MEAGRNVTAGPGDASGPLSSGKGRSTLPKPNPRSALLAAFVLALFSLAGCGEEPRVESRSVDLDGARSVEATIEGNNSELTLSGGAEGALDASFAYEVRGLGSSNTSDWTPRLDYGVSEGQGTLSVALPNPGPAIGTQRRDADLRLNDAVPLALRIRNGDGHVTADFSGRQADLRAEIKAGSGPAVLRLPADAGARVEVDPGFGTEYGSVDATGFTRQGNAYVSTTQARSGPLVHVHYSGVGRLKLKALE